MTPSRSFQGPDSAGDLVARAAGGDERAFARIVRLHHADLVRATFVATGDEDLAEAAARAAWPVAWSRLRGLRDVDQLPAWLAAIAASEAASIAKRRRDRGRGSGLAAPASAAEVRLRTGRAATMRVRPVDADAVALAARQSTEEARHRLFSVAVSAVVGTLVAAAPWLLRALHR